MTEVLTEIEKDIHWLIDWIFVEDMMRKGHPDVTPYRLASDPYRKKNQK